MTMESKMASVYDPQQVENKWYEEWKEKGYFKADPNPEKPAFSIVMPPPNVTGQLHLGHALDNTIQDILSRWRRMQGYSVLWLPGTDHAGIATQAKVEEALRKECKPMPKFDLRFGRLQGSFKTVCNNQKTRRQGTVYNAGRNGKL